MGTYETKTGTIGGWLMVVILPVVGPGLGAAVYDTAKREEHKTINMDEERKAAMVSHLLVVLCGHEPPRPVINTGTLYT